MRLGTRGLLFGSRMTLGFSFVFLFYDANYRVSLIETRMAF